MYSRENNKPNSLDSPVQKKQKEIRIRRVSNNMKNEVRNVAAHLGISENDYLKVRLLDVLKNEPEHYKKPMEK